MGIPGGEISPYLYGLYISLHLEFVMGLTLYDNQWTLGLSFVLGTSNDV